MWKTKLSDCSFSYSNNLLGIHILDSVLQIRNKVDRLILKALWASQKVGPKGVEGPQRRLILKASKASQKIDCNSEAEGLLGLLKQHNLEILSTRAHYVANSGYLCSSESDTGRCALFVSHPLVRY